MGSQQDGRVRRERLAGISERSQDAHQAARGGHGSDLHGARRVRRPVGSSQCRHRPSPRNGDLGHRGMRAATANPARTRNANLNIMYSF